MRISGTSSSTGYAITTIRIWLEGDEDTGTGGEGGETGGDDFNLDDGKIYEQHYVRPKTLPTDGKAVTMAIVGHTKFRDALAPYIEWKTQQGYNVVDFYADEISAQTGTSGPALAEAIRQRFLALPQRPSFVLLAGDIEEVPSFKGKQYYSKGDYYTDYFYGEYTDDYHADAYVGRFSANSVQQLQNQMDKTRHMAMLRPEDGEWLKQSLLIQEPQPDISIQKEVDFLTTYPTKFKGNNVVVKAPSYTQSINSTIADGCSFVTYTGHAGVNGWGKYLSYNNSSLSQLNNTGHYPVVMAITCLSGTFSSTCFAENFMQKKDGGAVVYVDATRESWDCGFFYAGGNKYNDTYEHLGFMRSLFPTSNQDKSQQARTIGEAVSMGNFGMLGGNLSSYYAQCVEYTEIFGDPTYQPYITTPKLMTIEAEGTTAQDEEFAVMTAPEAVVCLSQGRTIVAVALADKEGNAVLRIPADAATGKCVLYSSAPGYNDDFTEVLVAAGTQQEEYADIDAVPAMEIMADVTDVIALGEGITTRVNEWDDSYISGTSSGASYLAKATTYAGENAFVLRNNYEYCSIVTDKSGGNVRTVKVDWQCETGEACKLGIYGSDRPFYMTNQAWNSTPGTLLGTIMRGDESPFIVEGSYPYICIRVEEFKEYPKAVLEADIARLEIGWDKGGVRPMGDVTADKLLATDDVEHMTRMLLHEEPITAWSDVDGSGRISIGDIVKLIGKLNPKK